MTGGGSNWGTVFPRPHANTQTCSPMLSPLCCSHAPGYLDTCLKSLSYLVVVLAFDLLDGASFPVGGRLLLDDRGLFVLAFFAPFLVGVGFVISTRRPGVTRAAPAPVAAGSVVRGNAVAPAALCVVVLDTWWPVATGTVLWSFFVVAGTILAVGAALAVSWLSRRSRTGFAVVIGAPTGRSVETRALLAPIAAVPPTEAALGVVVLTAVTGTFVPSLVRAGTILTAALSRRLVSRRSRTAVAVVIGGSTGRPTRAVVLPPVGAAVVRADAIALGDGNGSRQTLEAVLGVVVLTAPTGTALSSCAVGTILAIVTVVIGAALSRRLVSCRTDVLFAASLAGPVARRSFELVPFFGARDFVVLRD